MKKHMLRIFSLLLGCITLSGCAASGEKTTSLSVIYGVAAVLSLLLLVGCCRLMQKRKRWFVLLFSSVMVVNIGYTFLSVSTGLTMALWANRVAYLGSVFLSPAMLMIILNVTNTRYKSYVPISLMTLAVVMFLVAASPGVLPVYYKEVSFAVINGVSTLVKVYGPLHPLYLFYLLGYFGAMVTVIIRAQIKKTIETTAHAVILAAAVLVNIGVWLIEQLSNIDFEMLSVSYIISELFLLGVHMVSNENKRLRELILQKEEELLAINTAGEAGKAASISDERIKRFLNGVESLTPTERMIYDAYITGMSTKDVLNDLNIKENTLKFHNKNIYSKLGVSSRKQLLELYRANIAE